MLASPYGRPEKAGNDLSKFPNLAMAHFDEKSGIVTCETSWGYWYQTIDEVNIVVNTQPGMKGSDIKCCIKPRQLMVVVQGSTLIEGELERLVKPGESIWTLEDGKELKIMLVKSDKTSGSCWSTLLKDQYAADSLTYDEMEKKVTLQKIQMGNEGMDVSEAEIIGNYQKGGPSLPS